MARAQTTTPLGLVDPNPDPLAIVARPGNRRPTTVLGELTRDAFSVARKLAPPLVSEAESLLWSKRDDPASVAIAGPEGSEAPLTFRERFMVFDACAGAGEEFAAPVVAGIAQGVYVVDGAIRV